MALAEERCSDELGTVSQRWSAKKTLLSEFFEMLDEEEVGEHLLKHSDLVMVWSRIAHYRGLSYPLPSSVQLQTVKDDPRSFAKLKFNRSTVHRIKYAMKHATLIYPSWMLAAMGSVSNESFERVSVRYLGETFPSRILSDIVFPHIEHSHRKIPIDATRFQPSPSMLKLMDDPVLRDMLGGIKDNDDASGLPLYYVAIDDEEKAIVVCVRGTSDLEDTITDLNCKGAHIKDPQTGAEGRAHSGIWRGAYWITVAIRERVKDLLKKKEYSDYRLVITGHSLGAGTASLLGFIWGRLPGKYAICAHPSQRIDCIPFASPCILSEKFAAKCQDFIMSVALGTDIVTRVGISSIRQLCHRVDVIDRYRREKSIVYGKALEILHPASDADSLPVLTKEVNDFFNEVVNQGYESENKKKHDDEVPLYPCGRFLWFVPDVCMNGTSDDEVKLSLLKDEHIFTKPLFISSNISAAYDSIKYNTSVKMIQNLYHHSKSANVDDLEPMRYNLCEATHMKGLLTNLIFDDSFNSIFVHIVSAYHRSLDLNAIDE